MSPQAGTFAGPRYGNTEDLAFAGVNPLMVVRAGTGGSQAVRAAISRDGGANWRALAGEPSTGNGADAITISADAHIIVWTPRDEEPYFTADEGANWTACAGLSTGIRVVADAVNCEEFYAFDARSGNFYSSTNGAVSFMAEATVPAAHDSHSFGFGGASLVATPGMERDLWLVAHGQGLFHSTNGGADFTRLALVQDAGSLGLGKAAPGADFPALFLSGQISGLRALFRSDDGGENWVRINDDRHQYGYQYGYISHVTGDPRVFGRVYFATGGRGVIYGEIAAGTPAAKASWGNNSGSASSSP